MAQHLTVPHPPPAETRGSLALNTLQLTEQQAAIKPSKQTQGLPDARTFLNCEHKVFY